MDLYFVKIVGVCDFANDEVCEPKPKLFASDEVGYCDGLCEASPLKVDLDASVRRGAVFRVCEGQCHRCGEMFGAFLQGG